eukprot:GEMP01027524.1.p1 GENE.GEMP01027524.1~~GEMP01027524.1.p1  ORF type:complete len:531 (+),score=113.35 GEMP01027524.1:34-1626(+)
MGKNAGKKKFTGTKMPLGGNGGGTLDQEVVKEESAVKNWKDDLTPEERAIEDKRTEERNLKSQKEQEKARLERERKEAEEKKMKRAERQWNNDRKKLLTPESGILTAKYEGSNDKWYVKLELPDKEDEWIDVQGTYYCKWCAKHLNDCTLESHLQGKMHIKNAEWKQARRASCCSTGEDNNEYVEEWFANVDDEWGGHVQCLACDKYADSVHIQTAAHISRVNAWKESKNTKIQPIEEWLMYVFWFPDSNKEYDMGVKCLLCDKFCQDLHSHGDNPERASKEHKRRLNNYSSYVEEIRRSREKHIRNDGTGIIQQICNRQKARPRGPPGYSHKSSRESSAALGNRSKQADSTIFQHKSTARTPQKPMQRMRTPPPSRPLLPQAPSQRPARLPKDNSADVSDSTAKFPNDSEINVPSSSVAPVVMYSQYKENGVFRYPTVERTFDSLIKEAREKGHRAFKVTTAYDGIETTLDGQQEGGYLELSTGEVLMMTDNAVAEGEQHNNYKLYGFFLNSKNMSGWIPMICVEEVDL